MESSDAPRLGPVTLRVVDPGRTADWYASVLGLEARPRGADLELAAVGGPTLLRLRTAPGMRPVPRAGLLGLYHHALLLPSRADLGRFLAHLRAIRQPFASSDHHFSEALYLEDPDGLTLEVYADRPRSEWTWHQGELVAAVDPLDTTDLLEASAGTVWRGAPAGTQVGHLHFFVGDLATAARFHVEGLGFEVMTRSLPGALFVARDGYHHHVGLNVWAAGRPTAGSLDAGLEEWTLLDAEPTTLATRLAALGFEHEATAQGLVLTDPWGMRVRVMEP
jgi:catechol 2,3-dioxygenase